MQISPFHRSGLRGPSFSLAVGLKCKCKADWDKASCLLREVQLSAWVMIKWWHWCCPVATKQHAERGPASCRLRSGQPPACWEGSSSQPGVISDNVRTLSQTGCQYKACILLMIFQLRTCKYECYYEENNVSVRTFMAADTEKKRVLKMILLMMNMMVEKNQKKRAPSPIEERDRWSWRPIRSSWKLVNGQWNRSWTGI